MKLSSAQYGKPHRIITDEKTLRQCVFHIPFKRSEITLLKADTNTMIITLQIEYKYVNLAITYVCANMAEAVSFVDLMLVRCPSALTKEQTLVFNELLHKNSVPSCIETAPKPNKLRLNSPLEFEDDLR